MNALLLAVLLALPLPGSSSSTVPTSGPAIGTPDGGEWVARKKKRKKKKKKKKKKAAAEEAPAEAGAESTDGAAGAEGTDAAEPAGTEAGDTTKGGGNEEGGDGDDKADSDNPYANNPYADDGDDADNPAVEAATADDEEDEGVSRDAKKVVAPLYGEGFIGAPLMSVVPEGGLYAKMDVARHSPGPTTARTFGLTLSGEYTFLDVITAGIDAPLLRRISVGGVGGIGGTSSTDIGSIRVHGRYMLTLDVGGMELFLTPMFRLWLPTNTFGSATTGIEPLISAAISTKWVSVSVYTGAQIFISSGTTSAFYQIAAQAGSAPIRSLKELEFVAELNIQVEMTDNFGGAAAGRTVPAVLSLGARYYLKPEMFVETGFRFGMSDADFLYGNFAWTAMFGWAPSFMTPGGGDGGGGGDDEG